MVDLSRETRVSDAAQRYAEVVVPSPTNCLADVECREQRVAIHCNKISAAPPSLNPFTRTSSQYEIETYINESAR